MLKCLVLCMFVVAVVSGSSWVSDARLNNFEDFWHKLMQELINELEKREWCNLKLLDMTQTLDINLFNMRVTGFVRYTNGFVVSIQKIDTIDVERLIGPRTIDGESVPFATVRGKLNFRNMVAGYNVYANLTSPAGEYRSTGSILHNLAQIQFHVVQNLITKEITVESNVISASPTGNKMHYMPSSNITEAFGRQAMSSAHDSVNDWGRNIFSPILLDIVTTKLQFPNVCFNNC